MHITVNTKSGNAEITLPIEDISLMKSEVSNSYSIPRGPVGYSYRLYFGYGNEWFEISESEYKRVRDILKQVNLEELKKIEEGIEVESMKERWKVENPALFGMDIS